MRIKVPIYWIGEGCGGGVGGDGGSGSGGGSGDDRSH